MTPRDSRTSAWPLLAVVLAAVPSARSSADARPAGASPAPQAQSRVPVFGAEVELITVDAVVLDKDGRPVAGLERGDFVVTEDGKPVDIVTFEAFAQPEAEAEEQAAPSAVVTNAPRAQATGRAFAVMLDDLGISSERSEEARRAVRSFLETGARAGDEVVVATTSGDVWWSGRIPEGREDLIEAIGRARGKYEERFSFNQMTEYEAYRIAHYEDSPALAQSMTVPTGISGRASAGSDPLPSGAGGVRERVRKRWEAALLCMGTACEPMLRGRALQVDATRRSRTHATLAGVTRGLESLRGIRGRKSLLLFSDGFLIDPSDKRERDVVALSREANTAVYFLDVRGLRAMTGVAGGSAAEAGPGPGAVMETFTADRGATGFEDSVLSAIGSEGLAADTGGFSVRNTNDLGAGAARIADESRVFYMLGFNASEGKPPQAWRKLRVTTTRSGLEVRARKGYTLSVPVPLPKARKRDEPRTPDPAMLRTVDSPRDAAGLPLRARVYVLEPGKQETRVLVAAEFDTRGLAESRLRPRRLEMSAVVRMRDAPIEYRYDELVELTGEGEGATPWRAVVRDFGLPPGVGSARVVLRDPENGTIGSVTARFEVPRPDMLRLSTPIVTGRVEPAEADGARPQPALSVERAFPEGSGLYCQFEIVGAQLGPDGRPQVSAGLAIFSADGRLVRESPATPVAAGTDGRAVRLVGIDLAGLAAGPYDIVLDVRDEIGASRIRQREPFVVQPVTATP